jgi:hypothetical protein
MLKRERGIQQAHAQGRRIVLDNDQKDERMEEFMMWNACVTSELAIGDKSLLNANYNEHVRFQNSSTLPALFTCEAEPCEADIKLHAVISGLAGRFNVYHGTGNLHVDREYVRMQLQLMQSPLSRAAYAYKQVYLLGPLNVLKGGKQLVDAPGTGDNTPLHRRHLCDACDEADHIILVAPKNLAAPTDTMTFLRESPRLLKTFFDGKLALTVVHNLEKEGNVMMSRFRGGNAERLEAEQVAREMSLDAIVDMLTNDDAPDVATQYSVDEVTALIKKRVHFLAPYAMSYASLKFNAAADKLPDLEELLERTRGAELLGLLDGQNVERATARIDAFAVGPLAVACADVSARMQELAQPDTMVVTERLYKGAKKLMEGGPTTATGKARKDIRRCLNDQFGSTDKESPRSLLRDGLQDAFDAVEEILDGHLEDAQLLRAPWEAARDRKFVASEQTPAARRDDLRARCLRSLEAAKSTDGSGPHGMDLRTILLANVSLPDKLVTRMRKDVEAAFDSCAGKCAELVTAQLMNLASEREAKQVAEKMLTDFSETAGSSILTERLAGVLSKISERTLRAVVRLAKNKALAAECRRVTADALHATETDPSGVARYLDSRLVHLQRALTTTIKADIRTLLDNLEQDADDALRALETPRVPRAQVNGPSMPGMESYFMSGLSYIVQRLCPETRAATVDLLADAKKHGAEVTSRVEQLLQDLKAVHSDAAVLGRAAERQLEMHVLLRRLWQDFEDGGTIATKGQLNSKNDLPLPAGPDAFVPYEHIKFPGGVRGDVAHLQEVNRALAGHQLQLRTMGGEQAQARAIPWCSLWRALSHQLFASRNAHENSPNLLRSMVLAQLVAHYAGDEKNSQFASRPLGIGGGGLRVQEYARAVADGRLSAGMLELQFACRMYGVQVLVWLSCDRLADKPLLVKYDNGQPTQARAYNVVLENSTPLPNEQVAGALQHTFRSTQRRATKKSVSMSEDLAQVHEFSDPVDRAANSAYYRAVSGNPMTVGANSASLRHELHARGVAGGSEGAAGYDEDAATFRLMRSAKQRAKSLTRKAEAAREQKAGDEKASKKQKRNSGVDEK